MSRLLQIVFLALAATLGTPCSAANAQDKKPGDMMGRDVFDFSDGSHARYWRAATP